MTRMTDDGLGMDRPGIPLGEGALVRAARPGDVAAILGLVQALADYENEPDAVLATEADFAQALFPADRDATTWAEVVECDGEIVGMAVWFLTFSTWRGRNGIWLEDLFVQPAHRGKGYGVALLGRLRDIADRRGYPRVEWWVLDWNAPAIEFYRALGAVAQDEWTVYRIEQRT